jgi:type I restriction enzyme, S subunit
MAGEWRTATVQQLVDEGVLERPIDGNHGEIHPKASDFVERGIPFIMASDLVGGRVDTTHCAFISEEQARSLRKGFALQGDVLISHKATMGRTANVDRLYVPFLMLSPQVTYYRVKDRSRLSSRYLRLYFDSPDFQKLFNTWSQKGSTRSYLGITAQLDLPIVLPPPDAQRAIAHILGTLDDKIELNRRMNETLETMARALFKSWFVDFDPIRAKAEDRDPGLPKPLIDLFPARLVDSELGEISEGWQVKSLDEIAHFLNGLALQKYPPADGKWLPVIKIAQLRAGHTAADCGCARAGTQLHLPGNERDQTGFSSQPF